MAAAFATPGNGCGEWALYSLALSVPGLQSYGTVNIKSTALCWPAWARTVANRGLLGTANVDELGKLQAQLRKGGQEVSVEHTLAVPAARNGEFADDLKPRHEGQDNTQE